MKHPKRIIAISITVLLLIVLILLFACHNTSDKKITPVENNNPTTVTTSLTITIVNFTTNITTSVTTTPTTATTMLTTNLTTTTTTPTTTTTQLMTTSTNTITSTTSTITTVSLPQTQPPTTEPPVTQPSQPPQTEPPQPTGFTETDMQILEQYARDVGFTDVDLTTIHMGEHIISWVLKIYAGNGMMSIELSNPNVSEIKNDKFSIGSINDIIPYGWYSSISEAKSLIDDFYAYFL